MDADNFLTDSFYPNNSVKKEVDVRGQKLFGALMLFVSCSTLGEEYWVNADRLDRRTCPSTKCGEVGRKFFREKAEILEKKNGWGRATKYYDASCVNGKSEYVKSGRNDCAPDNGIKNGKLAEWLELRHLSKTRPEDHASDATGVAALIGGSDDYRIYKDAFIRATESLLSKGMCTETDIKENGAWTKSTKYRDQPIYFVYCGGMTLENKIHLDASNGNIFK